MRRRPQQGSIRRYPAPVPRPLEPVERTLPVVRHRHHGDGTAVQDEIEMVGEAFQIRAPHIRDTDGIAQGIGDDLRHEGIHFIKELISKAGGLFVVVACGLFQFPPLPPGAGLL